MGTHPIFESDFDCLTDRNRNFGIKHDLQEKTKNTTNIT